MKKSDKNPIHKALWEVEKTVANSQDYVSFAVLSLALFFLKFVTDIDKLRRTNSAVATDNGTLKANRIKVNELCSFDYLFYNLGEKDFCALVQKAFLNFEQSNPEIFCSQKEGSVFGELWFSKINEEKEDLVKDLITKLSVDTLNFGLFDDPSKSFSDAFDYLLERFDSSMGRKYHEFFTPSGVSILLANLVKTNSCTSIYDPTCGTGSLLVKARQQHNDGSIAVYGQEISLELCTIATLNLLAHGYYGNVIKQGDSLREPKFVDGNKLMKFDTIVATPPFAIDTLMSKDDMENDIYNRFWRGTPASRRSDWVFISHMLTSVSDHGKVAVVTTTGALFRGADEAKIRQHVVNENLVEAVVALPAKLFANTQIPVTIVLFNKAKTDENILFISATEECEKGKTRNQLRESDIKHIIDTYQAYTSGKLQQGVVEQKYSYVATSTEVRKKSFDLSVGCYVDVFDEPVQIDITKTHEEIIELQKKLTAIRAEITEQLKKIIE